MPELNPYAKFLDSRPVPEIIASTPAILEALAEAIGPDRIAVPPAPGKWTPAEILCHLADCELVFAFRLSPPLVVRGLAIALLVGMLGGFLPALRAARVPVTTSLRES